MTSNTVDLPVLYEDNHIIVVNKPAGRLSQGDITGDPPITEQVKKYLQFKYHKPGAVFLGLVHRLDRPTSGALLLARTSKALERLNNQMKQRAIRKTYWAIVGRRPPAQQGLLRHFLTRLPRKNITRVSERKSPYAQEAVLEYRLLESVREYYLLEIVPHTGRQHQIRTQLSSIGCPIAGDVKYGYPYANADRSICLHAYKIQLVHPVSKQNLEITAPPPPTGLWQYFSFKDR